MHDRCIDLSPLVLSLDTHNRQVVSHPERKTPTYLHIHHFLTLPSTLLTHLKPHPSPTYPPQHLNITRKHHVKLSSNTHPPSRTI
ncbi:hypothetical protein ASPTUDRAFT_45675 [Aspergillus tubingensis CBS 134.48]|uniref:Uncharacterized protein n=1 Tax=Aspergillus tubingensis (strain CBS 134.48) TaxID=767770 RepID=A0A1L9MZ18_ASPTC|nr:hypothetical protein ASPTUDRAFT_45675 [Aspergillus tubingensis CBS 134.48]